MSGSSSPVIVNTNRPCQLLKWRRSRLGWNHWRWTDPETDQKLFDHVGILQHRDDAHTTATTWAGEHIDHEDTLHQLGPGQDPAPLATWRLSRGLPVVGRVSLVWPARDHARSETSIWSEDTLIARRPIQLRSAGYRHGQKRFLRVRSPAA